MGRYRVWLWNIFAADQGNLCWLMSDSPHWRAHSSPLSKPALGHRKHPFAGDPPGRKNDVHLFQVRLRYFFCLNWYKKTTTYRHRAISCRTFHNGGVSSVQDRPWSVDGLHTDFFTVYQQLHLTAFHTQGQLVPLSIEQFPHTAKGSEHSTATWAGVEEV